MALPAIRSVPLSKGASGEDVVRLQTALQELGLYRGIVDGQYGEGTASGVRQLQRLLGVTADGQFGAATVQAYLKAADSLSASAASSPGAASAPASDALSGFIIGVDPGHQRMADYTLEPIAPGSSRTKERMSAGAAGVKTGIYEYEITLQIATKLKKQLEDAGAKVVMTRSKHDVSLSNVQRAQMMNEANVNCWVRIHCDHSTDREKSGICVLYPADAGNEEISAKSKELAEMVLDAAARETEAEALGAFSRSDQTGFNWSAAPVITIELGFLSNPTEDVRLNRSAYQTSCARGILLGIVEYLTE